jgi:hypothetical protein
MKENAKQSAILEIRSRSEEVMKSGAVVRRS